MSWTPMDIALRETRPDLPLVLAPGYIAEELRAKAPSAGVSELICKPDMFEDLCETMMRRARLHLELICRRWLGNPKNHAGRQVQSDRSQWRLCRTFNRPLDHRKVQRPQRVCAVQRRRFPVGESPTRLNRSGRK